MAISPFVPALVLALGLAVGTVWGCRSTNIKPASFDFSGANSGLAAPKDGSMGLGGGRPSEESDLECRNVNGSLNIPFAS